MNDGSLNASGDWTTIGRRQWLRRPRRPPTPKASIGAVLAAYDLNPGDVIRVDACAYPLGVNIVLDASTSGITIEGYHDDAFPTCASALIDRLISIPAARRSTCRTRSM